MPERLQVVFLFILMNALGYHRNKIEKRTKFTYKAFYPTYDREFYRTIRSGFYDVDHICYASKCNYFVTCDYALSSQAMEIYRYLGCNRLNELFDNQIDFTREGDVDTLYLFVDKRIQYHDNGTNRHVIPIFMLAYLFENNSSKRQLILSDVFSEIREMKSRVRYERIKLKEPVHLGEITVI